MAQSDLNIAILGAGLAGSEHQLPPRPPCGRRDPRGEGPLRRPRPLRAARRVHLGRRSPHLVHDERVRQGPLRRVRRRRVRGARHQGGQLLPGPLDRPSGADEPLPGARAAAHPVPRELPRDGAHASTSRPKNYEEWLHQAMGPVFADTFPAAYTRKYWTHRAARTSTSTGSGSASCARRSTTSSTARRGRSRRSMYYVDARSPRYPSKGGFLVVLPQDGRRRRHPLRHEGRRRSTSAIAILRFDDGTELSYQQLVSTPPAAVPDRRSRRTRPTTCAKPRRCSARRSSTGSTSR